VNLTVSFCFVVTTAIYILQVYEALVEEKGKNFIFMRLSATCVKDLQLKPDTNFPAEVSTVKSFP